MLEAMALAVAWLLVGGTTKFSLVKQGSLVPFSTGVPGHYSATTYSDGRFTVQTTTTALGTTGIMAAGTSTGAVPLTVAQTVAALEWRNYSTGPWGS